MGSFSIWHWIILGVLAVPVFVIGVIVWALRRGRRQR